MRRWAAWTCVLWLTAASAACSSSNGGDSAGTCESVCQNLTLQCGTTYIRPNCVDSCNQKNLSTQALTCCTKVTLPQGKCAAEGPGQVGAEDCDDSDVGCK